MATCKDCFHCKVCTNIRRYYFIGNTDERFYREGVERMCKDFADRSRFVELPCKVGDTLFMITEQTQKVGRRKATNKVIVECCVDNFRIGDAGYPSAALCDNENSWYYGIEPKMFGETVFFSQEEAEQALKEREENA